MNNYLKYKAKKLINETLEQKANEVMEKLKFNKPGSSFDYVEEGHECNECGGEMSEGECMECGYMNENDSQECNECGGEMREGECSECGGNNGEVMEKLYGNQKRIDKNHNNRIDREDFKMLRGKKRETNEYHSMKDRVENPFFNLEEFCSHHHNMDSYECQEYFQYTSNDNEDDEDTKEDVNENVFYELTTDVNGKREKLLFTEGQFEEMIENIVIKEEGKFNKGKTPAGYAEYERSIKKSKTEEEGYMKDLTKKMKDYLKDGSKGEYTESPKHFPKGNGELAKMDKKAYVASGAIEDYIDNFTAAGLENLDYDEIHPDEDWVTDNVVGSSRTGNNPEWANAVETPNNEKRNKIRKDNMLAKLKRKAYNKSPQPVVTDKSGSSKGDDIMAKLESIDEKKKQKINEDFTRIMDLMSYKKNTQ